MGLAFIFLLVFLIFQAPSRIVHGAMLKVSQGVSSPKVQTLSHSFQNSVPKIFKHNLSQQQPHVVQIYVLIILFIATKNKKKTKNPKNKNKINKQKTQGITLENFFLSIVFVVVTKNFRRCNLENSGVISVYCFRASNLSW